MAESPAIQSGVGKLDLSAIGSPQEAQALAERTERTVPAYRQFLAQRGWNGGAFSSRPPIDKASYLLPSPFDQLLGGDSDQTLTIFKSSGSSGHSFYWPQLKSANRSSAEFMLGYLERTFEVHRHRTLAIVGLALGSWIGGEHLSWVLKNAAAAAPYPFAVFSPGSSHEEIIEMCRKADRFVDRILVVLCPSAIGHLMLRAEQSQRPLPLAKMRYLVLGEPFDETLRISIARKAGLSQTEPLMFSIYGSADTGPIGVESPASVALRKILRGRADRCIPFGCNPERVPHFFHACAPDAYLEIDDGEILVTRWQGVPLVRYNLHDAVRFYDWAATRETALSLAKGADPVEKDLLGLIEHSSADLPPLVAVFGRSDASLILCGTNLSESMLDAAVRDEALAPYLTGIYRARIAEEDGRQILRFDLELRAGTVSDSGTADAVYARLVQALGRQQPEFLDDWRNVYSAWDADPKRRILQFDLAPWPTLSRTIEASVKQRGIRK